MGVAGARACSSSMNWLRIVGDAEVEDGDGDVLDELAENGWGPEGGDVLDELTEDQEHVLVGEELVVRARGANDQRCS